MAEQAPQKLDADDKAAAFLAEKLILGAFFPEFTSAQIKGVFPNGGLFLYPAGYRLINQGDKCQDLFVLYEGKVEVIRPFVPEQKFLAPGDIFGEIALVRDGKRTATVIATVVSKVFFLPYCDLQYVISNNPLLGQHLSDVASRRL